ncbi:immunoglobulin lambda-like polypeptide 1 [Perca fluviatilis]|uniref:immunoglobulin lambda-like polypeptide 1 n=1 Tax=Perca fluviatilis TaxID=8168 RepID=UPI0019635F5D|nr:immunoglobulin lambda-like polypeptide 1 [Perca fluviatilis]
MILVNNLDWFTSADTFNSSKGFCITQFHCGGGGYYYIFGSGTKLIVTDEPVVKPVVSVYPAASRAHLEGKSALACLASAMFPPLVQFSWKRRKENGPLQELPPAEREQLEIRKSGCTASILLIHQQEKSKYKYRCYVQHEGGTVEAETQQEVSTLPPSPPSLPPAASVPSQYLRQWKSKQWRPKQNKRFLLFHHQLLSCLSTK